MTLRDSEIKVYTGVGLLRPYESHVGGRPKQIGKTSIKYKGKTYRRRIDLQLDG